MALLVATHEYEDSGLRQLTSPPHDAEGLAAVLADPQIAGFEVTALINEPQYRIGQAIGEFYQGRRRDVLVLLYFSGHGLKDDTGKLYLATTNTARDNLLFTAVSAEQVDQAMDACVSRQKVLVLDCCYGGAFPAARLTKGDTAVHALERFNGRGRTVLTASDATQYSFEGDQAHGEAVQSVFTRYLVSGLRDGSADLDGDGDITLDELYSYVHDRVVEVMPQQRPKRAHDHRPQRQLAAAGLPGERDQESYRDRPPRALEGLAHLYRVGNETVRGQAGEEIRRLANDDSRIVSTAAANLLTQDPRPKTDSGPPPRPAVEIPPWHPELQAPPPRPEGQVPHARPEGRVPRASRGQVPHARPVPAPTPTFQAPQPIPAPSTQASPPVQPPSHAWSPQRWSAGRGSTGPWQEETWLAAGDRGRWPTCRRRDCLAHRHERIEWRHGL